VLLVVGNLYFQLHALPERWAHKRSPVQIQIVAILALLALFTHNNIFWIAALLLALVQFPDFATPIYSMADSLRGLAGRWRAADPEAAEPGLATPGPRPAGGESVPVQQAKIVEVTAVETVIETTGVEADAPTKGGTDA
jgi:hypothetical protein